MKACVLTNKKGMVVLLLKNDDSFFIILLSVKCDCDLRADHSDMFH